MTDAALAKRKKRWRRGFTEPDRPEVFASLPDTGCPDLLRISGDPGFMSCFTCPLPECRYDAEDGVNTAALVRDAAIVAALQVEREKGMRA